MRKHPPHILVTTPESLYLLLTSESGRTMLADTRSVIVDEIHAVAATKRGAHLALSLERLAALCPQPLQRIGLSATQKPITDVAQFLVGAAGLDACTIVDSGHVRTRDLAMVMPDAPLQAVMSNEVWQNIYDQIAALSQAHRTTLVFANTRRMVERVTRHLSERLGETNVAAHHGSLAKEQRLDAEQRLKHGQLRVLVATASLELGIDIGDVELVCQLGSPRSIATFLQRVGRANHAVGGVPKGRVFPLSNDELVECTALLAAVRQGQLDKLIFQPHPLDVLSQQLVAEVSAREWDESELFALVRRAWPYRDLLRSDYDAIISTLADGVATRRGRQGAYLHRDAVNNRLRARRGAKLTAITCGGAIPDNADYQVLLEPTNTMVGTLNEDFAIESNAGDVFQLGNTSYRVLRIEAGRVRVEDAKGTAADNSLLARRSAGSNSGALMCRLADSCDVSALLPNNEPVTLNAALDSLVQSHALPHAAAQQLVDYLAAAKAMLGELPTQSRLVFERFFDETGGMQLIIHSPFGGRINRAYGLALRKRFCKSFNFELQAAATEDAIILSLGETHSFALEDVARYLSSNSVEDVLTQAVLDAPLFATRWRWNASISLAVQRRRGGKRTPAPLQRIASEDLISVVFPDQLACAENLRGEREIPDHPLVKQTLHDCLHEAMDVDGLKQLLRGIETGTVTVLARDLPHPSPLAQEILNARPYAFLDDAPLEERRTQAVASRRWLDPRVAAEFGQLNPAAIARVRTEAWPSVRNADELHDALALLGLVSESAMPDWMPWFDALVQQRRAARFVTGAVSYWAAVKQLPMLGAVYTEASVSPPSKIPVEYAAREWSAEQACTELVRGRLAGDGPRDRRPGAGRRKNCHWPKAASTARCCSSRAKASFCAAISRRMLPRDTTEWCERRLLARIHRYTIRTAACRESNPSRPRISCASCSTGRASPSPPAPQGVASPRWQSSTQLEGYEIPAVAWESEALPARMGGYEPAWLDQPVPGPDAPCGGARSSRSPPRARDGRAGARHAHRVACARQNAERCGASCHRRSARARSSSLAAQATWLNILQTPTAHRSSTPCSPARTTRPSPRPRVRWANWSPPASSPRTASADCAHCCCRSNANASSPCAGGGSPHTDSKRPDAGVSSDRCFPRPLLWSRRDQNRWKPSRGCCCAATASSSASCSRENLPGCLRGTCCCACTAGSRRRGRSGRTLRGQQQRRAVRDAGCRHRTARSAPPRKGRHSRLVERCGPPEPARHHHPRRTPRRAGRQPVPASRRCATRNPRRG